MGTDESLHGLGQGRDRPRSVGLPPEIGGIPLDEIGATGYGLCVAAKVAAPRCGLELAGARVAVQGFGSVGRHAARFLAAEGAVLVAAADSRGMVEDQGGLDLEALAALKAEGRSVVDDDGGETGDADDIIAVDCDIWIPAARPDVIRADNVGRMRTRLVLEGANIPSTTEAETALHERGVTVVPDFIANAGGVICAAVEYRGGTQAAAFHAIEEKILANTAAVLDEAASGGLTPRAAATAIAERRVRKAMDLRRWH